MIKRILALAAAGLAFVAGQSGAQAADTTGSAEAKGPMPTNIYEIPVEPMKAASTAEINGNTLAPYKGDVMLIVNVASRCGYTPQYQGLEALHRKYKDRGLRVVGFPSNDFKGQEPGTEEEIVQFCKSKYDVTFPLYAKVTVKGDNKAPLYRYLTEGDHPGKSEVSWNFNKYLVGRDGKVIAHFDSKVKPDSPELTEAIEKALEAK